MFHKQAIVLLDLTKFYKNKLTDPESLRKLCKKKKKIKTVFASFQPLLAQD